MSLDGGFDDIEVPWKGRTLTSVEINFENYKRQTNNPDLKLYRTSKRIWHAPNLWIDNLTNRRWTLPFAEPVSSSEQHLAKAKRAEPKEVEPVIYRGIKYIAPHFRNMDKQVQRGGYVEAWDIKNNNMLWELQVYETKYNPKLEQDAQDIFITSLEISHGKLVVTNERNDIYAINLDTRKIEQIK